MTPAAFRLASRILALLVLVALSSAVSIYLALKANNPLWLVVIPVSIVGCYIWVERFITQRIIRLVQISSDVNDGKSHQSEEDTHNDELGVLSQELNELTHEVVKRRNRFEESKEKFDLALRALQAGVVVIDSQDRLYLWNEFAYELLDWTDFPQKRRAVSEAIQNKEVVEMLTEARKKKVHVNKRVQLISGRTIECHITPASVKDEEGLMLVLQDISEAVRMTRARQDFVGNASHELRTPLTAIKGYVDALSEGAQEDPELRKKFINHLSKNVSRLIDLANDLLELSKIESGKEDFHLSPMEVKGIVSEVVERFRSKIERAGLTISFECDDQSTRALANEAALVRVVDHLIENASKYTPAPGKVIARVRRMPAAIAVEVQDTGVGIPKTDFGRIFERFYRGDRAHSTETGGTGIGLTIVRNIVDQTKAKIEVESEIGKGSVFRVLLPKSVV